MTTMPIHEPTTRPMSAELDVSSNPAVVRGETVDVYRNLQHGGLSVLDRTTTNSPTYGRVIARVPEIHLSSVSFESYEGKRKNAEDSGRKNVHAFLRGQVTLSAPLHNAEAVQYTVARPGCWYSSGRQVSEAEYVRVSVLDDVAVKAIGVRYDEDDR